MNGLKQADQNLAKFHLSPKRQAKSDSRKVSDDFCSKKKFFESISANGPVGKSAPKNLFNQPSVFSSPNPSNTKPSKTPSRNSKLPDTPAKRQTLPETPATDQSLQLSKNDLLLTKMAAKQAQLAELQKQQQLVEFEILEIQALLQDSLQQAKSPQQRPESMSKPSFSGLKKTTSSFFDHGSNELRKTVSTFFQPRSPAKSDLRNQASAFFSKNILPNPDLKNKASMMLNTTLSEVKEKLDQQQTDLESFTRKGTDFAREILESLSPKKPNAAESSFIVENLVGGNEASILLSDDESFDEGHAILASLDVQPSIECAETVSGCSIIDIDDYESSDDD